MLSLQEKKDTSFTILPPTENGILNRVGLFIPQHTLLEYPEFATFRGLKDSLENRQKLASIFLKPVTWGTYCSLIVSESSCAFGNASNAERLPMDDFERDKYWVPSLYKGYFQETSESFCNDTSIECFGHFIDTICEHRSNAEALMYWNNIPLVSRGPVGYNKGYYSDQTWEIVLAAYETKSHVLIVGESPSIVEAFFTKILGESIHRVQFPSYTDESVRFNLLKSDFICSNNKTERIGVHPIAGYDFPVEYSQKIVSSELKKAYDSASHATRSPALDFIQAFKVDTFTMTQMFVELLEYMLLGHEQGIGGIDERETVCHWVYNQLEQIEPLIPYNYPRDIVPVRSTVLQQISITMSVCTVIILAFLSSLTYALRDRTAIRNSQLAFLFWILAG